jgi:urease accessory protein
MDLWLVLQVADSAFPVGGFAHSGGLEAAVQLGEVVDGRGLDRFACAAMWQAGYGALPILGAAYDGPDDVARLDAHHDAFLTGTVANRASRTQGRTFVAACARIFEAPAIVALEEAARADRLRAHLAPMFGATMRALAVARADALTLYLHLTLRAVASAAVRLGVVGPHEAQRIHRRQAVGVDRILETCGGLTVDDMAQPAPFIELVGQTQDRLYSRLFQS